MSAIKCPECGSQNTEVIDSRWTGDDAVTTEGLPRKNSKRALVQNSMRRRRKCENGHRITTYEVVDSDQRLVNNGNQDRNRAVEKLLVLLLKDFAEEHA